MNPKRFLTIGGAILVTTGILGVTHLLGKISDASFFNPPYWINWFHLTLGVLVLIVAFSRFTRLQALVTLFPAIVATAIGLLGLIFGSWAASYFNNSQLADPSDHLVHLAVGLAALWAWRNRPILKIL